MEHSSDLVAEGKLIHEETYPQRSEKYEELEIEGIAIDYYDAKNKIVHEIKKSNKMELAHEIQLKYYIYVLERNGLNGVTGILEYPTMKKTKKVELTDIDKENIGRAEAEILQIIKKEECPAAIRAKMCVNCSYYEFCFVSEESQL